MAAGGTGNRPNPPLADRRVLCGPSGCGKSWRAVVFSGLPDGSGGLPLASVNSGAPGGPDRRAGELGCYAGGRRRPRAGDG